MTEAPINRFEGGFSLVAGGATGIGRALAQELARRGSRVVIADVDLDRAQSVAAAIGPAASAKACDVADRQAVERLAADLEAVDFMFANAGVALSSPVLDADPVAFERIFAVNVRGVWNMAAVFGKRMIARGRGHLCLTASEHAFGFQHGGAGIYTASKHAVYGMAEILRTELPATVGLSVLCPGLVATEIYDSARYDAAPRPDPFKAIRKAVIDAGMPAADVARATLDGVALGRFLIVTHAHSRVAADRRCQEISAAFEAQAPMTPDADRYDVQRIAAQVRARLMPGG